MTLCTACCFRRTAIIAMVVIMNLAVNVSASPPTHAHIAYANNWRHRLDLYIPQDRPGPFPVVVYLHGGGWLAGDKSSAEHYADDLMARGMAVAAVNYRFSYQATFPAQLHDCKGAIRFLRANAAVYNLDPDRFGVFGESSGGHLASLVGTVGNNAALEGEIGGNLGWSSHVSAVVDGYGPTDLFELALFNNQRASEITALIGHDIYNIIANRDNPAYASLVALVNAANPAFHAAIDDPPAYIVHGDLDSLVPYSQSVIFSDALNAAGAPETLRLLSGVGHEIPASELPALYDFLSEQLAPLPISFTVEGKSPGEGFGYSIAVIGDVNGDSVDDFIVGAPFNSDNGKNIGRAVIVSGADGTALRVLKGRASGDRFGFAVAGCGDINNDGIPDVMVGSPHANANGSKSGRVDIFAGATWKRLRTIDGRQVGDQFGYTVAAADVDGDGIQDFICGSPFADMPAVDAGSVFIHNGTNGKLMRRFNGGAKNDRFGFAVANAGDVDGDGRDDVIIGAPLTDKNGTNGGSFIVVGLKNTKWVTRLSRHGKAGERLGYSVAGTGDADGDGLSDVAAGAPSGKPPTSNVIAGVARVYSPASKSLIATLLPPDPQAGANFGASIAGTSNLDPHGLAQVVVGSPGHDLAGMDRGRVVIFSSSGDVLRIFDGLSAGALFGSSVSPCTPTPTATSTRIAAGARATILDGQSRGAVHIMDVSESP